MRIKANTPKGGYWPPLDAKPCLNISLEMQEQLNTEELLQKLERLDRENERLKGILLAHGISRGCGRGVPLPEPRPAGSPPIPWVLCSW
jgi:hypothetical protein